MPILSCRESGVASVIADEHSRYVENPVNTARDVVFKGRVRPLVRYAQTEPVEYAICVFAPGNCHGRRTTAYSRLNPADDPGDQFAHRCIRISIGASSNWNHGSEFRVTETGKRATDTRYDKGKNNGGTRRSAIAAAVRTNRPAPIIAPIPSATRLIGPESASDSARQRPALLPLGDRPVSSQIICHASPPLVQNAELVCEISRSALIHVCDFFLASSRKNKLAHR